MKEINVGLIGLGTIGIGTAKVLTENSKIIEERLGARLVLKKAADLDIERDRGLALDASVFTTNAHEVIHDQDFHYH
jgi:homoserine dehydrogenase